MIIVLTKWTISFHQHCVHTTVQPAYNSHLKNSKIDCVTGSPKHRGHGQISTLFIIEQHMAIWQHLFVKPLTSNLCTSDFDEENIVKLVSFFEKMLDKPKTIILCNTMNEIASVTNHLLCKLDISAYDQKLESTENCLVGIYHSNSWQASKDYISGSLKENGLERIPVV